jgi:hypothetical protein
MEWKILIDDGEEMPSLGDVCFGLLLANSFADARSGSDDNNVHCVKSRFDLFLFCKASNFPRLN